MDTYARATVEKFLRENGCIDKKMVVNGRAIWIKDDSLVIQLPNNFARIDYDYFEMIAIEQLGVGFHEFDYWLGQNEATK